MAANAFSNSLKQAAESMRQIADAAGDAKLKKLADTFEGIAQNIDYASQGAQIGGQVGGGWGAAIGATAAGIVDWIRQIIQAGNTATANEKLAVRYAKEWNNAIKDAAISMDELNYKSFFGERNIAKGLEGARAATEAMKRYNDVLREYGKLSSQDYEGLRENIHPRSASDQRAYELFAEMQKENERELTSRLKNAVVTTQQHWLRKNTQQTLSSLYPELFNEQGEINIENVKKLLETESLLNDEINKDLRNQLEELVKLKEEYDDAMSSIEDVISGTFNTLASDITDIIWDSVMNGTDAWENFQKVGSSTITALGKQLMQELLISTYLDNFREQMKNAYLLGDATATQNELRSITAQIFGGLTGVFDGLAAVATDWKQWAEQEGFDLTEAQERSTASKAISGVSQESFDDALGRFTAIQSHTYEINETTKALHEQQGALLAVTGSILLEVKGIHSDTEKIQASIEDMKGDMAVVRSGVTNMNDKGVRMLN